jgi:hypothetical protein
MARRKKKTDGPAKESPLEETVPMAPKADSEPRRKTTDHKSNRKDSRPVAPKSVDVTSLRNDIIIPGFGMSVPAFRVFSSSDEETYIPVGFTYGYYTPLGQDATTELFPQQGTMYAQRIISSLRNMGYENDYTVADVRDYFQWVAGLLQMQRFVRDIRTLIAFSHIHTSGPASILCSQALNGRLVAIHRRITSLLATLPFDPKMEDLYIKAFGPTTTSDSPFGPIRLWAPKQFETVVTGTPGTFEPLTAHGMADAITEYLTGMYADASFVELASVLGNMFKTRQELDQIGSAPFSYNQASINNLLNLSYFDGSSWEPKASDTTAVKYFYRRKVVPEGMCTFAPDNNLLNTPQSTVWTQKFIDVESSFDSVAVKNDGELQSVTNDTDLFGNFGRIWETSLSLSGSPGPSVAYVTTTFSAVSTGLADMIFN